MSSVVLVTGGSGFLGQHVIKLLQTEADFVGEIRTLDIVPFTAKLDYAERLPVKSFVGSLRESAVVLEAVSGVDCVINVAGVVDVRLFPNVKKLYDVNYYGIKELLEACRSAGVTIFIHTSTVDVVMGNDDITDGTEDGLGRPESFLFGDYAASKCKGEEEVLRFDNTLMRNGKRLRTVSLRPVVMYGELDPHFVSRVLQSSASSGGTLYQFDCRGGCGQFLYVGNMAWATICAYRSMCKNDKIGGEAFFVTDDTPTSTMFEFCEPYLNKNGHCLSSMAIPYWVMVLLVWCFQCFAWIISPVFRFDIPLTMQSLKNIGMRITFSNDKAKQLLGFSPFYDPMTSRQMAMSYYRKQHNLKNS